MSLACYYALGGLNYKNGFATSCPQQSDQLQILNEAYLPSDIINSENFVQHRIDLMKGVWPHGCDMCERVECSNSGRSMREEEPIDLQYYNNDGTIKFAGLKTVEIRFSHSCNMSCLHCSQVFSSGWMSKLKRYQHDKEDTQHQLHQLTGVMHRKSPDDDLTMSISTERALEIVNDLNKNFPNIERIDFAGGEVLYQKQFFPTLRKLAEHPNAKNMKVMFHSNFNTDFDPVELSNLLQNFGKSLIMLSVDAGPRIYPYFRQGNWNKLKQNIQAFRAVNNCNTQLNLVCTTGVYQIMELSDVFEGFLSLDSNHINASIIFTPDYLNPSIMMLHYKDFVVEEFARTRQTIENILQDRLSNLKDSMFYNSYIGNYKHHEWTDIRSAKEAVNVIEKYVFNYHAQPEHWEAFKVYVRKTDVLWKQDFNNYVVNFKFVEGDIKRNV
jgi:MoaA/NifB/PqqE/SkfB family radical SAM enzyme